MHFVIATYLILRTFVASRDIRTICDVSTDSLRFLCSFLCYDVMHAIVMMSRNFTPIYFKLDS